jgi:hypothetical protein
MKKNLRAFGHNYRYLKQRHFELFPKSGGFYSLRSDPDPGPVFFRGRTQIRSKWTGSANTGRKSKFHTHLFDAFAVINYKTTYAL